ncbi:MAG: serine hydrolase [Alphaproteobacteria bacterium]|nr:serine hydrolase [Alphaproteobacteria bacterium]
MHRFIPVSLWVATLSACTPIDQGPIEQLPAGPLPVQRGTMTSQSLADEVDAAVLGLLEQTGKPGMSVAVFGPGQVLYAAGYGWADLASAEPMTPETPVLLSSVSKTFIAVAAMQGQEAGRLSLDSPAGELLGFPVDNPYVSGEVISLRHLLTHSSGLRDSMVYPYSYTEGDPEVGLRAFLFGYFTEGGEHWTPANYARALPGDAHAYSNTAAALGALAIAEAASLEFLDLVDRDILQPLGMVHSAYHLRDQVLQPATPYATVRSGFRPWAQYGYPTYPDGMLRSGAEDLARFGAAVLGGGSLDGVQILSTASVDEMLAPQPVTIPEDSPLGDSQSIIWYERPVDDYAFIGHSGGDLGSFTELWLERERQAGVLLLFHTVPQDEAEVDAVLDLETRLIDLVTEVSP